MRRALVTLLLPAVLFLSGCRLNPPLPTPAATAALMVTAGVVEVSAGILTPPPTPDILPTAGVQEPPATGIAEAPPDPSATPAGTPLPTPTPTATQPPTATPLPPLIYPYTIEGLGARDYPGGEITVLQTLETTDTYTRHYIAYPSDGLTITGILQTPPGPGPFPVIILNHGYNDRDRHWPGSGTWMAAEYLNERGYLTIAPDYRSWGESDWGPSLFHTGLVADVANLISSLPSWPTADPNRVGVWGHSMGGGITTKLLTFDPRIRAAVLYGTNSGDDADLIARWGRGCLPGESLYTLTCNPGEVITDDLPPALRDAYVAAAADPALLQAIAPIYHLDRVNAPVQIYIGTADGVELAATPPEWSYKLHEAFLAAGKQAELFVYEGQGHLFQGQAWADPMARTAGFFDLHVKNAAN